MSDYKLANERLKARIERLTEENERLRQLLDSPPEVEVSERDYENKKQALRKHCLYGMEHFCDGKVNKSMAERGTRPFIPCPRYDFCLLRKESLYD